MVRPVYYNDPKDGKKKLVGAVAFTMSFLKKPVVGITPIKSMLRLKSYHESPVKKPNYKKAFSSYDNIYYRGKKITTPLVVNGSFLLNDKQLQTFFSNENLIFVPGNAEVQSLNKNTTNNDSSTQANHPHTFIPGDACAVNLVSGDVNISGVGTVTYVSNQYIYAFGHSMDNFGAVDLPLHQAKVDTIIPLQTVSFKISTVGREIGRIVQDRNPAIMGVVEPPKGNNKIPMNLSIKSPIQTKQFQFNITKDPRYFSSLSSALLLNSFLLFESQSESTTAFYTISIETDYHSKQINIEDRLPFLNNIEDRLPFFNNVGAVANIAFRIKNILKYLAENRFLPIGVKKIDIDLKTSDYAEFYNIESVEYDKAKYHPGDKVNIRLSLSTYQEGLENKVFDFQLPKNIKVGQYSLLIGNEQILNFFDLFFNQKSNPNHPNDIFSLLNKANRSDTLVFFLFVEKNGLSLQGKDYPSLPRHFQDMLFRTKSTEKKKLFQFASQKYKLEKSIFGFKRLDISIEEKND